MDQKWGSYSKGKKRKVAWKKHPEDKVEIKNRMKIFFPLWMREESAIISKQRRKKEKESNWILFSLLQQSIVEKLRH